MRARGNEIPATEALAEPVDRHYVARPQVRKTYRRSAALHHVLGVLFQRAQRQRLGFGIALDRLGGHDFLALVERLLGGRRPVPGPPGHTCPACPGGTLPPHPPRTLRPAPAPGRPRGTIVDIYLPVTKVTIQLG